jgi:protein SCO1/2
VNGLGATWRSRSLRRLTGVAAVLALLAVTAAATAVPSVDGDPRVRWADTPVPVPDFTLTDDAGRPFDRGQLHGRPALIFFGFTHCNDVCPATVQVLQQVHRELGKDAAALRLVFVSVDGDRDTPGVLHDYLAPLPVPFLGLTGNTAQVRVLADRLSAVFFKGMPTPDGGYDVEHTSQVYLVDADARLRATFFGARAAAIETATRQILGEVPTDAGSSPHH